MRTIEVTATSVDKAVDKGLMMLGASKDDVSVKVINAGSMLTKAKIEMTVFASAEEKEEYLKNNVAPEIKSEPVVKKVVEELPYDEEKSKLAQKVAYEFMEGFLKLYTNEFNLIVDEQDKNVHVNISGEKMGGLIGHHGEGLESLQYLLNQYVKDNVEGYVRKVYLDIENYRSRRESTLEDMANRLAQKVIKNKRSIKLEPMNRYERKVIHTCLQNQPNIATHSEGKDPNRYLVIDYISNY